MLDDLILQHLVSETIEEAVQDAKNYVDRRNNSGEFDETYSNVQNFLSEYRDCAWRGKATEQFKENLLFYVQCTLRAKTVKQLVKYALMATVSGLAAYVGSKINSQTLLIAANLAAMTTVIIAYTGTRHLAGIKDTMNEVFKNKPDIIDNALKQLYKKR